MKSINYASVLKYIYVLVFNREIDHSLNIFLCGLNPDKGESIRTRIFERIKNNPKFNIVYPEWLFSNLLASKEHNLLDLEKELASNVDVIIIPLEGLGTIAELGSFASFSELTNKIIVINNEKYKFNKSFVNQGPINLIRSRNKKNIIY